MGRVVIRLIVKNLFALTDPRMEQRESAVSRGPRITFRGNRAPLASAIRANLICMRSNAEPT